MNLTYLWRDRCLAELVAVSVTEMSGSPFFSPIFCPPASSDDKMHFVLGIFYKAAKSISSIPALRSDSITHLSLPPPLPQLPLPGPVPLDLLLDAEYGQSLRLSHLSPEAGDSGGPEVSLSLY